MYLDTQRLELQSKYEETQTDLTALKVQQQNDYALVKSNIGNLLKLHRKLFPYYISYLTVQCVQETIQIEIYIVVNIPKMQLLTN